MSQLASQVHSCMYDPVREGDRERETVCVGRIFQIISLLTLLIPSLYPFLTPPAHTHTHTHNQASTVLNLPLECEETISPIFNKKY
jgi:hypothetical protein